MRTNRKIVLFLICSFSFITVQAQEPVLYAKDSVIELPTNATILFFQQNEKIATATKTLLLTKSRKTVSLSSMLTNLGNYADHALADLDKDGKKELLLYNYTGGAHCCDEIYIFKNTAANKYQHVAKLSAGNTVITDSSTFIYSFLEPFGEFFSCYTCGYVDSADEAPIKVKSIELKYKKGVMSITRGDQELRSKINDNLGKLAEIPYEKFDIIGAKENGVRKEFALNLAVFYFSFGKNLSETKKLLGKYYKFPDQAMVSREFVRVLNTIKKESDL
jgi:hypothetical protein